MSYTSQKMGFWAVFALVTGSQIGSGVFMLPANLAPYGMFSLIGWIFSGIGAISLALVFAQLCSWLPKTGGPHAYVQEAFGPSLAFFTGWTYWVVSWVSTTVVVVASIGYLTPLTGITSPVVNLLLAIALLLGISALNLKGVVVAGRAEFLLTVLKVVPLLIIPLCALSVFDIHNFVLDASVAQLSVSQLLGRVTLLTLWGFIGIESATTAAGAVENPSTTIPRAVVIGTACVALLYLINSLGIMGAIPGPLLATSNAPYVDVTRSIIGGNWFALISLIASIICIGTLNAWTLVSSQIVLGLAEDGLMPAFFAKKNAYKAPFCGIIVSTLCTIPLLIMTTHQTLAQQILTIIDFSVTAFLFIYIICCFAFLKILLEKKVRGIKLVSILIYTTVAIAFCSWIIYETSWYVHAIASLFVASGVPCYIAYRYRVK